jgi:hypothetical protein
MKKTMIRILVVIGAIVIFIPATYFIKEYLLQQGVISLKVGDFNSAINYFRPIAHLGDSKAQYYMGQCYIFGLGTEKDDKKGVSWLKRASKEKSCTGDKCINAELFYVGKKHLDGRWGPANSEEALYWINRSAEAGYPKAIEYMSQEK